MNLRHALNLGLGSAMSCIQDNVPFKSHTLRDACLRGPCANWSFHDEHAPYLYRLIQSSGEPLYYRDALLAALAGPPAESDDFDLSFVFTLAAHFIRDGDDQLKPSLYACFECIGFPSIDSACAEQLVLLDGLPALYFVIRTFHLVDREERPRYFQNLIDALETHSGQRFVPPDLQHFQDEVDADDQRRQDDHAKVPLTVDQVLSDIEAGRQSHRHRHWAETASAEDLDKVAEAMLSTTDPEALVAFAIIFGARPFPRDHQLLLHLASTQATHQRLQWLLYRAVSRLSDPALRTVAMNLAEDPQFRDVAVQILILNHDPSDYALLEQWLQQPADASQCHDLAHSILRYAEAHRSSSGERMLLTIYETVPCVLCRHAAVKALIAIDRFTAALRQECLYDSKPQIRALAAS